MKILRVRSRVMFPRAFFGEFSNTTLGITVGNILGNDLFGIDLTYLGLEPGL